MKKVFLESLQNLQKNTYATVSFLVNVQASNFIKKETLAQVFSCEFFKIFKDTLFTEHLWMTAYECLEVTLNERITCKNHLRVAEFKREKNTTLLLRAKQIISKTSLKMCSFRILISIRIMQSQCELVLKRIILFKNVM